MIIFQAKQNKNMNMKKRGPIDFEGLDEGRDGRGFQNVVELSPSTSSHTAVTLRGGLGVHYPPKWRLDEDRECLLKLLEEQGVVMIPEVITEADAEAFSQGMKEALSTCNPAWAESAEFAPSPGTRGHGLQKLYGVGLSQASQRLRCHPNVVKVSFSLLYLVPSFSSLTESPFKVFSALYDTEDLVGSVDAPGVVTIHTLRARKGKAKKGVFAGSSLLPHVDMTEEGPSANLVTRNIYSDTHSNDDQIP